MSDHVRVTRRRLLATAGAGGGFVLAWYLIHHGFYALDKQWDTIEYARYAHNILVKGVIPYRDFSVEYPPLALPIFVIPSMIAGSHFSGYMEIFGLGMAACGVIAAALTATILLAQGVGTRRLIAGIALVALAPLLMGAILLSRYDLFPAMLTIAALAALSLDWNRSGFLLLALGTAAKAYPAVILPLAIIYVWRRHGPRPALVGTVIFAAVVLACFLPFVIIAPHGIWWAIHGQENRPLQIESVGAALFLAAHQLIGLHLSYTFTHSSDNLDGHPAFKFAELMGVLQLVALAGVWLSYARGPATRDRLLTAAAAAVCVFIVFDRVLSPQYLIWLAPLVAVVPGRRGVMTMAMLACAMCMTQIWYPLQFVPLKHFLSLQSWAVIGRDLLLVSLFFTLVWRDAPLRDAARAPAGRTGHVGVAGLGLREDSGSVRPVGLCTGRTDRAGIESAGRTLARCAFIRIQRGWPGPIIGLCVRIRGSNAARAQRVRLGGSGVRRVGTHRIPRPARGDDRQLR